MTIAVAAFVAVRFYEDRPQPERWRVLGPYYMSPEQMRIRRSAERLNIQIESGRCIAQRDLADQSPLDRIQVEETATDVTITAYVDPVGHPLGIEGGGSDCLTLIPARVDLSEPLGSRTLHVGGFPNLDPGGPALD